VLVEIITAANMTGIKEAQAGFLGMSSAMTAAIAGLGLAVVAGKSAIEIAEKHEKAEKNLAQAIKESSGNTKEATDFLDSFIASNRAYIDDQAAVIDGYATLVRSGLSQVEAQKDLNRALDLAALKNITLAEAVDIINKAEHGRVRGLVDLGITSAKYVDSSGNVIAANHKMAEVMVELDAKTAHGRDTMTETSKATNKLSNDWQDIANNVGPPLLGMLDGILRGADWLVQKLKELGANKDWNDALATGFGVVQDAINDAAGALRGLLGGIQWLIDNGGRVANFLGGSAPGTNITSGRAAGGPVAAGGSYIVGENQAELLTLFPGGGGYVTPSVPGGGGGNGPTINISIGTYVGDASTLSKMLAHELRLTGAFR
jgi:hypothetical protein